MRLDFLHAANEDYQALQILTAPNVPITNAIGVLAEQCCEKYLKHLILVEKRDELEDFQIPLPKEKLHHLTALCSYLYQNCHFNTPFDIREDYFKLSRLYQSVRYPGHYFYHNITPAEVTMCVNTARKCRAITLSRLKEIEIEEEQQVPHHDTWEVDTR